MQGYRLLWVSILRTVMVLFDMSGNVWEWCLDEYNADFYAISPARNPLSGANSIQWILDNYTGIKSSRVLRGGSWNNDATNVRVAYRTTVTPSLTYYGLGSVVRGLLSRYLTLNYFAPCSPPAYAGGAAPKNWVLLN